MVTLTWHLLLMIVVSVFLLIGVFKESDGLDFSPIFYAIILVAIWGIYGGVVIW